MSLRFCRLLKSELLPNQTFLNWVKFKGFADDKFNFDKMTISLFWQGKKHSGKMEKNAGYQNFLLFLQCFENYLCQGR